MKKIIIILTMFIVLTTFVNALGIGTTGLVSEWRFENNTLDSRGTNNGTIVGNLIQNQTGKLGNAYKWDGNSTTYVKVPDSNSLDLTTAFSICYWVNRSEAGNLEHIINKHNTTNNERGYFMSHLLSPANTISLTLTNSTGQSANGANGASGSLASINTWIFVCATWNNSVDSGRYRIYQDGTETAYSTNRSQTDTIKANSQDLWIGSYHSDTTRTMNGTIDEVTIWNRQLNASEVNEMYNDYLIGQRPDDNTTDYVSPISINWSFDSGSLSTYRCGEYSCNLTISTDSAANNNQETTWMHFEARNISNRNIIYNVTGINSSIASLIWNSTTPQIVYACNSSDENNWTRLLVNFSETGGNIVFALNSSCSNVTFATYIPYPNWRVSQLQNETNTSVFLTQRQIGNSSQGREINALIATNASSSIPNTTKKVVVIVSQQHPSETEGSWNLEGMLRTLINSSSSLGKTLRDNAIFYFIPQLNRDGVNSGLSRSTTLGFDMNREWDSNSVHEVNFTRNYINQINSSLGVDLIIDIHGDNGQATSGYTNINANETCSYTGCYANLTRFTSLLSLYSDVDSNNEGTNIGSLRWYGDTSIINLTKGISLTIEPGMASDTWTASFAKTEGQNYLSAIKDYFGFVSSDIPQVTINSPASNFVSNNRTISINLTVSSSAIKNTTIVIYNSTNGIVNSTINNSNINQGIIQLSVNSDGIYVINVSANDTSDAVNSTRVTNITIDTTSPNLTSSTLVSSAYTSDEITLSAILSDALSGFNTSACRFEIAGINYTSNASSGSTISYILPRFTLVVGVNTWTRAYCNDIAGNQETFSINKNVTISTAPSSGGGSGGGGSVNYPKYSVLPDKFLLNVAKNQVVKNKFKITNLESGSPITIEITTNLTIYNNRFEIAAGKSVDVEFTLNPGAIPGTYSQSIQLRVIKGSGNYRLSSVKIDYVVLNSNTFVLSPFSIAENNTNTALSNNNNSTDGIGNIIDNLPDNIKQSGDKILSAIQNPAVIISMVCISGIIVLIVLLRRP